jgi:catechol 2,3-dioxygenase-like lactoylglutathione lyase family enzyme
MKARSVVLFSALILTSAPAPRAQLTSAKDGPIVYGHHHLNVTSVDAHRRFWVDTLGGTSIRVGTAPAEVFRLPNVLIFMNQRAPSGGTKGTTVNHVGFQVPSVRAMVDKVKAAGYPIVTRAELPAQYEVKDDLGFIPDQNTYVAFVMAPDDTKVEFVENKTMAGSIALHHIHFAAPEVNEMRDWYVKTFGAKPGKRGSFEAADLPGVNLTFSPSATPVVGTRGRAIDHIGFEVKNLEAFCKGLEAKGITLNLRYTKVPAYALAAAYITDPWGTYIELTEGLDAVP